MFLNWRLRVAIRCFSVNRRQKLAAPDVGHLVVHHVGLAASREFVLNRISLPGDADHHTGFVIGIDESVAACDGHVSVCVFAQH